MTTRRCTRVQSANTKSHYPGDVDKAHDVFNRQTGLRDFDDIKVVAAGQKENPHGLPSDILPGLAFVARFINRH